MTFVLIGIVVLLVGGVLLFLLKSRGVSSEPAPVHRNAPARQAAPVAIPSTTVPTPANDAHPTTAIRTIPAELSQFQWAPASSLDETRQQQLLAQLRQIPRPSKALHKLVSPEFIHSASSIDLSELVLGEPHIAAKVLATVNSPLYGLQRPVVSIGQGVTFLGLNTVRGICLQYLLNDSFKPSSPEVKKVFDTLWGASTLASELCHRLGQKLHLPDTGVLVTQVVLSFLGHLAALSLLPSDKVLSEEQQTLLGRLRIQQDAIGLNAVEIGHLLMQEWALPTSIVDEVVAIDRVLLTPVDQQPAALATRRAVSYLCARLGEHLAFGKVTDLASYNPLQDDSVDLLHLQSYLALPQLAALVEALQAPDVVGPISHMVASLRAA